MKLLGTTAVDIQVDTYDWPRCHKCKMPVEKFRATDTGYSIILVAECHGDSELAEIPDEVWDTMLGTHINFGLAFTGENKL